MALTPEQRMALVGTHDVLWTSEQCAAFLGLSTKAMGRLPIPRVNVGGAVRFIPEVVRKWVACQTSHSLPSDTTPPAPLRHR